MDTMRRRTLVNAVVAVLVIGGAVKSTHAQQMDTMWGE